MLDLADGPSGEFRGATELGHFRWLASDGHVPVGYIDCGTFDRWTSWDGNKVVRAIEVPSGAVAFTVAPGCRRLAYGREMLFALFETPEVSDIELFGAGVQSENIASIRCLRAAGFSLESEDPDFEGMLYFIRRR